MKKPTSNNGSTSKAIKKDSVYRVKRAAMVNRAAALSMAVMFAAGSLGMTGCGNRRNTGYYDENGNYITTGTGVGGTSGYYSNGHYYSTHRSGSGISSGDSGSVGKSSGGYSSGSHSSSGS